MPNQTIKKAVLRKQALLKEIEEIDNFIKLYQVFSGDEDRKSASSSLPRRGRPNRSDALSNYIFKILSDGKSLQTKEILEKIDADNRGDLINANDRLHSISVVLSRDPRFVNNRITGWSLKLESPADNDNIEDIFL